MGVVVLLAAPAVLSLLHARRAGTVTNLAEVGRPSAVQTAVSAQCQHVTLMAAHPKQPGTRTCPCLTLALLPARPRAGSRGCTAASHTGRVRALLV